MPKKAPAKKRATATKKRTTRKKATAVKRPVRKTAKRSARPAAKRSAKKTAKRAGTKAARSAVAPGGRVIVENVNVPGYKTSVDATKYNAMRETLLKVLPRAPPGLTQAEMMAATEKNAPQTVFPGGEKAGWWTKCVQLDLEAKGIVKRSAGKPLRWHATGA